MTSFTYQDLKNEGFQGFLTIRNLRDGKITNVTKEGGVYVLMREIGELPVFLETNSGGHFKGKNPTVSKTELISNWVDGAHVIYIGKGDNLQRRIKQFIDFGAGNPIGHWGGRLVWQIEKSEEFIIAWKAVSYGEPAKDLKNRLLQEFQTIYGRLPYGNLRR